MFGNYPTYTVARECVVTRDYIFRVFLQSMVNDLAHITPGVIKDNCANEIPGATYVNKKRLMLQADKLLRIYILVKESKLRCGTHCG